MFRFYESIQFKIFLIVTFWNEYSSRSENKNIRLYTKGFKKRIKKIGLKFLKKLFLDLFKSKIRFDFNLEEFLEKRRLNLNYSLRQILTSRLLGPNNHSFKKA